MNTRNEFYCNECYSLNDYYYSLTMETIKGTLLTISNLILILTRGPRVRSILRSSQMANHLNVLMIIQVIPHSHHRSSLPLPHCNGDDDDSHSRPSVLSTPLMMKKIMDRINFMVLCQLFHNLMLSNAF